MRKVVILGSTLEETSAVYLTKRLNVCLLPFVAVVAVMGVRVGEEEPRDARRARRSNQNCKPTNRTCLRLFLNVHAQQYAQGLLEDGDSDRRWRTGGVEHVRPFTGEQCLEFVRPTACCSCESTV